MSNSSHQKNLVESIRAALKRDKKGLINDFKKILPNAKKLFSTDDLDFWLLQICRHPCNEIPVTKYGHAIAVDYSAKLALCDRDHIVGSIGSICESLFTYSNSQDVCCRQGDYHYFFSIVENRVYKESELGWLEGLGHAPQKTSVELHWSRSLMLRQVSTIDSQRMYSVCFDGS